MYMLQLFDGEDAIHPIDARLLQEGVLGVGRDPGADWPIADPDCAISRAHCEFHADQSGLSLTALGANGVFDDADGTRFPEGSKAAVPLPGALRMGRFRIVATLAPHASAQGDAGRTMVLSPPLGQSIDIPSEWTDNLAPAPIGDGSLLEAFCEGAGLDASQLASEDPQEIMHRAGALYRQMILGIGDLMSERDQARSRYQLTRTTIGGERNNPFKWAPSQRLAIDLLLAGSTSFLSGPAALKASFRDIKRHLVATFAGLQESLRVAVDSFNPERIDEATADRASLLKSRNALQAEEMARRHGALARELADGAPGALDRAFVAAYDRAEASLNRGDAA